MLTRRQKASTRVENHDTTKKHKIPHSPNPTKRKTRRHYNDNSVTTNDKDKLNLDSKTVPSQSTQNGIVDTALIACHSAIKHVLTMKYANIVERLHLTFPAKCTQSLKACSEQHARNTNIPISDNKTASQTFLKNKQPLMFIHSISMDVVQNKFPGRSALQSLFELILCINAPSNGEYEVQNTIDMIAFTIGNIFEKFPPCWQGANTEYRSLITATNKDLILGSNELLNNRTLFDDIIHCIENVIQPLKKTMTPRKSYLVQDSFNDSLNDSLQLLNFQQWESKNAQKYSFDNQKREEKIDRLFLTLALFVQLFEIDLAMWTIKNLPNPSAKISNALKNPLISTVLWSKDELTDVNFGIKNILKLYVNYISIDFPREYTQVLGRLVNLIYNIFELREVRPGKPDTDYPQLVQNQSYFCDSFAKIIFDIVGCNVGSWLKIIKIVGHPRLKLYLITALLTKIDHKIVTLAPKSIYFSLKQIESEFGDDFNEDVGQNNNVVKTTVSETADTSSAPVMKYPYLQKVSRRAASELTCKQHAELLLTALNSYISVFHIKECQQYWKNFDQLEKQQIKQLGRYKAEVESFEKDPAQPFDLKVLEKLQQQSFDERVSKITSPIYGSDVMTEETGITEVINIKVNVKKYRDDLKFCDMIATELPMLQTKFGAMFPRLN
ncbi:uncharacterized protein LOC129578362 [Sitodiplosis mosellana]|uniref:uncharacterized protein LOC129578362 n=1 Tax=Sitodiplosis mosellana TaxID=263140 RepID=UPI00244380C7|nr:uncharacterized protein LOC129578362 [Sitodiplosis mosellana]